MIKNLILIGLFVLPLFVLHGYDLRYPRELLALCLALGIAMYGMMEGCFYAYKEQSAVLLFIGWCMLSILFIPHIQGLRIDGGESVDGLWNYKAILYLLIYAIAFFLVGNMVIDKTFLNKFSYAVLIPAVITSVIVIAQSFGIENFLRNPNAANDPYGHLTTVTQYKLGGLMGHPTISSAYLAVCAPFAFYLRRYWMALLIGAGVFISNSNVSSGAMVLSLMFLFCFGNWKRALTAVAVILWVSGAAYCSHYHLQDSGRFAVWVQIWHDMTTPFLNPQGLTYFFTGFGIGSFAYLFPGLHSSAWLQAHNEYLEVFFGAGAVGLGLMLYFIFNFFKSIWTAFNVREIRYFSTSLFAVCICAGGTFVWHLGVFCFYTVIIAGVLCSLIRRENARTIGTI